MKRMLATFVYFFLWQRVMAWTTGIGGALMISGEVLPPELGFFAVLLGAILAVGIPITFAGVAFREIISNRRFVMVPEFRSFATLGLLLLAITGTGVTLIFGDAISPDMPIADPVAFALVAFSAISVYLLVTQWLVTRAFGLIGFILVPLIGLRLFISIESLSLIVSNAPWLLASLALLCWAWLIVAVRRPSQPRALAALTWGQSPASDPGLAHYQWLPQWGRPASPRGTIMRGMPDGLSNRVALACMAILAVPVIIWLLMYLLGAPLSEMQPRLFGAGYFLVWSLFGLVAHAPNAFREWPARLRYLWLRMGGDRNAGWQVMERSLLAEILIIGGVATLIALIYGSLSEVEPNYLILYVAACVLFSSFGSYAGFWTRASNWHEIVHALIMLVVLLVMFGGFALIDSNSDKTPEKIYWLLSILGVLTVIVRARAKRRLTRIDWCAVRPARMQRKNT